MREAKTPPTLLTAELELIRWAAVEAGEIAMQFFGRKPSVWLKDGQSPVTEADLAVDRFLKRVLLSARPNYGWISEETQDERTIVPRCRFFIVDPIDGTRAFIAGQDMWCISISIIEAGRPITGVLNCPVRGEIFEATLGSGARQNNHPITVADLHNGLRLKIAMARSALAHLSDDFRARIDVHPYIPSLAYCIALIARGEIAGAFVRPNSYDWDLVAADLILAEAGGRMVTATAQPLFYGKPEHKHGALIAASGSLVGEMLDVIAHS